MQLIWNSSCEKLTGYIMLQPCSDISSELELETVVEDLNLAVIDEFSCAVKT